MNNYTISPSECSSSGCESGWTSYLENSYMSTYNYIGNNDNTEFLEKGMNRKMKEEDEEEEDLSMVSDASSGPPHVHHHEYYNPTINQVPALPKKTGKKGRETQRNKIQKQPSLLDDTASSPLFNNAMNNQGSRPSMLDFSQGYSTTHFQGGSTYQENYGIYYPSIPPAGNHHQQQQQHDQWYEEKRW